MADTAINVGALLLVVTAFRNPGGTNPKSGEVVNRIEFGKEDTVLMRQEKFEVSTVLREGKIMSANVKTALLLFFLAAVFFAAVVIRHWLW